MAQSLSAFTAVSLMSVLKLLLSYREKNWLMSVYCTSVQNIWPSFREEKVIFFTGGGLKEQLKQG